ncbi:NepR family anti-sigma factor [Aquamicrobium sp. LC103]|uniref:NepR family anti-sigma factor n=1 Tax=Aquamicrobium sp. LC103 TaxID=1120658 RepID=UPI00063EAFB8|nr:NepR family anti-sigma factor [Aquamicrobium sp. LC103]TKT75306.1 hypothetical protein XW59_019425 [Aquamicrobium sp. LC103]
MKTTATAAKRSQKKASGGSDALGANSEIGRKLKQYYDELISDDIPDKFADLLRQLEEREEAQPARQGE